MTGDIAPSIHIPALDPGAVALVGGGPGDPGLLTLAGLMAIRQADVIVHDRLAPLECLTEARPEAEIVPVGKIPRGEFTPQQVINDILVDRASAGLRVVRLKGGDNFVFGRGGEEWQACAEAGIPVRVIPGVTSAVAVPALAGIPVTHRSLVQGFTVVSGHVPPGDPRSTLDWDLLARGNTTLVILMGVHNLAEISARLIAAGMDPAMPAAVIMSACSEEMGVVRGATVADVAERAEAAGAKPPAVTVIGPVAGLHLDRDAS